MTTTPPAPFVRIADASAGWHRAAQTVAAALDAAAAAGASVPSEIGGTLLVDPAQTAAALGLDVRRIAYSNRLRDPRALRNAHRTLARWLGDAIALQLTDAQLVAPRPDGTTAGRRLADLVARQHAEAAAVRAASGPGDDPSA